MGRGGGIIETHVSDDEQSGPTANRVEIELTYSTEKKSNLKRMGHRFNEENNYKTHGE